eukprot:m.15160 g.15160  ORF g.15160 m.15160 type:complete len:232 (+) comp9531_c0_seq1:50-745(+)
MPNRDTGKRQIAAMFKGPGPGAYNVQTSDSRVRRQPSYTMGGRTIVKQKATSPGPCYNLTQGFTKSGPSGIPSYSLGGRHKPLKTFPTPAPGAYRPESQSATTRRNPAWTMSGRTPLRKKDKTPSPNDYSLPDLTASKRKSPAFSMTSRSDVGSFFQDKAKTPAANKYNVDGNVRSKTAPAYSMGARVYAPTDKTKTPGPGAYAATYNTKRNLPSFSFRGKHSEYSLTVIE